MSLHIVVVLLVERSDEVDLLEILELLNELGNFSAISLIDLPYIADDSLLHHRVIDSSKIDLLGD